MFGDNATANAFRDAGIIIDQTDTGKEMFQWPGNLMTKARIELQLESPDLTSDEVLMRQFGYTVIYLALVMYTILFLFRYLKRLLMLTFLTIIAPLMAMTYPLDKMKDGSAQGFNTWLKEYLYNLLIQPVHLILYTVLIGSAIDLVADNLIYALVALGFILQAEKLLRKFFGFEKASTIDGGSALGGALAMQGMNMVAKAFGKGSKGSKSVGKGTDGGKLPSGVRKGDKGYDADSLYSGAFGNSSSNNNEGNDGNNPGGQPLETNNGNQLDGDMGANPGGEPLEGNNRNEQLGGNDSDIRFAEPGMEAAEALRDNGLAVDDRFGTLTNMGADTADALNYNENGNDGSNMLGSNIRYGNGTIARVRPIQQRGNNTYTSGDATTTQNGTINGRSTLRNRIYGQQVPRSTGTETLTSGTNNTSNNETAERNANSTANRNIQNSRLKNIARTAGNTAKYLGPKAAKFAAKTAVKTTLAGAGAMVGMTAGLVSDNYGNVGKFGAAGAAAGLAMGSGAIGTTSSASKIGNNLVAAAEREYAATHTADEVEARQNKQADAAWMRDKERVKYYQDKLNVSKKEAQRVMREEAIEYRKHGITDDKAIVKAMKYKDEDFGQSRTSQERILLAQLASGVSKQKDIEQVEKGFKRRGIKEQESGKYIRAINKFNNW